MALTEQQMAKLKEETSQIKREIWQDESAWNNLAEQIDRQQTVLLQAQAEMQFAKKRAQGGGSQPERYRKPHFLPGERITGKKPLIYRTP